MYSQKNEIRAVTLSTFLIFQLWHAYSHIHHIANQSNIQANIIHLISYGLSLSTLYSILYLSKSKLSNVILVIICILTIIDIYTWVYIGGVWSIITNLSILAFVVFSSYNKLPNFFKNFFYTVF